MVDPEEMANLCARERGGLVVKASDSAPLGSNRVVSLSKAHLLPKKYW